MEELRRAWRVADEQGFEWASVWDHFYLRAPFDWESLELFVERALPAFRSGDR